MSAKRPDVVDRDWLNRTVRNGIVRLRVRPGKKRDLLFQSEEVLIADISAPARAGKANERLVMDLSRWLDCPASRIRVEKGLTSREKAVSVSGMDDAEIRERVARALDKV